jgi:Family of unknown function (DUF6600)
MAPTSRYRNAAFAFVSAISFIGGTGFHATPASAQVEVRAGISFGYFEDRLSRYGRWFHDDRWGDVWQPRYADDFRPYYDGYWEDTEDYGWMWVSDEPWADITYHYGRWVFDPDEGWLWIPGYVWAPAWVIWREDDDNLGWFPMPPDYGDFDDGPYYGGRYGWDDFYGYRDWYRMDRDAFFGLWIFVDQRHFYRHDYRSFAATPRRTREIIPHTRDSTRYTTLGDRIVNRSVPNDRLERAMNRRIETAPARRFLHADVPLTGSSLGRGIARQEQGSGPDRHSHGTRDFSPQRDDGPPRTITPPGERPRFEGGPGNAGPSGGSQVNPDGSRRGGYGGGNQPPSRQEPTRHDRSALPPPPTAPSETPQFERRSGNSGPFGGDNGGRSRRVEHAPPQAAPAPVQNPPRDAERRHREMGPPPSFQGNNARRREALPPPPSTAQAGPPPQHRHDEPRHSETQGQGGSDGRDHGHRSSDDRHHQ